MQIYYFWIIAQNQKKVIDRQTKKQKSYLTEKAAFVMRQMQEHLF